MRVAFADNGSKVDVRSFAAGFPRQSMAAASYLLVLLMPSSLFWAMAAPLALGVFAPYVTPGLFLPDVAVLLAFIALVANRRRLNRGQLEITVPLAGLCILAVLKAPWALSTSLALYSASRWIIAFCIYLFFAQRIVRLDHIVWVFLAGLCLQSIIGLVQVSANGPLGIPGEMAFPNSADLAWTFRAFGFTFHPNVLGGYLVVGLLLSIPQLKRKPLILGWWLIWLGLLATFSRSAWLAAALTIPLALIWHWRQKPEIRRSLIIAVCGFLIVVGLASVVWQEQMAVRVQPVLNQARNALETFSAPGESPVAAGVDDGDARVERALSSSNYSISERFAQFEIAFIAMKDSMMRGLGAGNFPIFMRQLDLIIPPNYVHNVPILLASEVGIGGAGLWLALCLTLAWWLIRLWKSRHAWAFACLCAALALLIIALFDFYPWGLNTGRLLMAMVLGFIARTAPFGLRQPT